MRIKSTLLMALLIVAFLASPVLAGITFQVNDKNYAPHFSPTLEAGVTSVPVDVISYMYGAKVIIEEDSNICISKNDLLLEMWVGQQDVLLNGEAGKDLPRSPELVGNQILVPFRAVSEMLGAEIGWNQKERKILVQYHEAKNNMTPLEVLTRSSQSMADINSYKMRAGIDMIIDVNIPGEMPQQQKMTTLIDASLQENPLLMYMEIKMIPEEPLNDQELVSEIVFNEEGFFLYIPEAGWVLFDIPGLDMKDLVEEYGSQDPVKTAEQMQELGALFSFAPDQSREGKNYWVVKVTLDPASFSKMMASLGEQLSQMGIGLADHGGQDMNQVLQDMLENMELFMVYDLWVNQDTFMMEYMDLIADIAMVMDIPDPDMPGKAQISMQQQASYEIYDFGVSFQVPEITDFLTMDQFMTEMLTLAPEPETL